MGGSGKASKNAMKATSKALKARVARQLIQAERRGLTNLSTNRRNRIPACKTRFIFSCGNCFSPTKPGRVGGRLNARHIAINIITDPRRTLSPGTEKGTTKGRHSKTISR